MDSLLDTTNPSPMLVLPMVNADYPACKVWFRMEEGAGTALTDKIGTVNGMTIQAPLSNWGTPHALSTAFASAQYARTLISNAVGLNILAGNTAWFEFDIDSNYVVTTSGAVCLLELGTPDGPSLGSSGIRISSNLSTGPDKGRLGASVRFNNLALADILGTDTTFHNSTAYTLGSRTHLLMVIDLSDPLGLQADFYGFVNGAEQAFKTDTNTNSFLGGKAVDPTYLPASTYCQIGNRYAGSVQYYDGEIYNLRAWVTAGGIPDNYAAIAMQMARNPNAFPSLLRGVL